MQLTITSNRIDIQTANTKWNNANQSHVKYENIKENDTTRKSGERAKRKIINHFF